MVISRETLGGEKIKESLLDFIDGILHMEYMESLVRYQTLSHIHECDNTYEELRSRNEFLRRCHSNGSVTNEGEAQLVKREKENVKTYCGRDKISCYDDTSR